MCGKTFTQRGALVRHMPMHTGERPHQVYERQNSIQCATVHIYNELMFHSIFFRIFCSAIFVASVLFIIHHSICIKWSIQTNEKRNVTFAEVNFVQIHTLPATCAHTPRNGHTLVRYVASNLHNGMRKISE